MSRVVAVALCALGLACSEGPPAPTDAGDDRTSTVTPDSAVPRPDAGARLLAHEGVIVPSIQLGIVYVGDLDAGGAPSDDPDLAWLVGSPYWLYLDEYGVKNGAVVGNVRIPTMTLLQPGDIDPNGLVDIVVFQTRLVAALHGDTDAGTASTITLPGANAYVVYLPDGLNIALGHHGSYTYQTCIDSNGYHAFDGLEPYAVLPACPIGRSLYAAAHELSELVTDPQPYVGWASDNDIPVNGGEVADLCADEVMQEGVWVTRLWSNQAGGCVP